MLCRSHGNESVGKIVDSWRSCNQGVAGTLVHDQLAPAGTEVRGQRHSTTGIAVARFVARLVDLAAALQHDAAIVASGFGLAIGDSTQIMTVRRRRNVAGA